MEKKSWELSTFSGNKVGCKGTNKRGHNQKIYLFFSVLI